MFVADIDMWPIWTLPEADLVFTSMWPIWFVADIDEILLKPMPRPCCQLRPIVWLHIGSMRLWAYSVYSEQIMHDVVTCFHQVCVWCRGKE